MSKPGGRGKISKETAKITIAVMLAICSAPGLAATLDDPEVQYPEVQHPEVRPATYEMSGMPRHSQSLAYDSAAYGYSRQWYQRLSLGGYGEVHVNSDEAPNGDLFDLHRLVILLGYEFTDWLVFNSELEIEHAFVSKSSGGEIGFEQAYVEYVHSECLHVRAGRVLVPLGIINQKHEPPTFNGVERPSFAKYIIPSTWSADGIGVVGWICPALKYEAYLVTSLDGSQFSATNGIRSGRIKERTSLNDMAFTGRLDLFPFAIYPVPGTRTLRTGVSTFLGGLDNGNKGSNPGIDGEIAVVSADLEYTGACFDLRGAFAYENISDAAQIGNGAASEIFGWYIEGAVHVWPECWRYDRMRRADAVLFARYDDFNTQYRMPAGVTENGAGNRDEWTFGITFLPVPTFAVKFDYQVPNDATANNLANRVNLGLGWQF